MPDIMFYDISTDSMESLTQEKFDEFMKFIGTVSQLNRKMEDVRQISQRDFSFKLAVYPNRMRSDGVFVAEDRPIEPYEGARDMAGNLCYPSTPQHGYKIGSQIPHAFAYELVRRWNICPELEAARLPK